jgi:growth factor-regulated tyrosine kinase substrate
MLAEMQDKLSQAVGLYGHILDGQQAYAARRMQEHQQRQYQQYNMPSQQYQPYGYENRYASPAPQLNGYTSYPQQQYQAPAQPAGPSLYPTIPQGQPTYTPQIYQPPQQTQPPQQHYQPQQQPYAPYPQQPLATSPGAHSALQRHPSLNAQVAQPQRQVSMPLQQEPQGYAMSPHPTGESSYMATAPPPVDLASHPSTSPQSTTAALPSALPGLASPNHVQAQMPPMQSDHHAYPTQHPPQPQQQQQSQPQQQQQQQHVYYPQSFPQAPAAVFPDAPSDDISNSNKLAEKEEPKEALLIEL